MEKTENKQKEAGVGPFLKIHRQLTQRKCDQMI